MPQAFHVLRCYSCQLFQVHMVKKTSKWQCKVCGEKQSILKVFGNGTSKECRDIVQHCNENFIADKEDKPPPVTTNVKTEGQMYFEPDNSKPFSVSKWSQFENDAQNIIEEIQQSEKYIDTNTMSKKRKFEESGNETDIHSEDNTESKIKKNIFQDDTEENLDSLFDI